MQFTCPVSVLRDNLALVSRAVPGRPVHAILASIKVEVKSDRIILSAFDLSIGIQSQFTFVEVEQEGVLTIPAKLLNDVVSKLPNGDVTLDDLAGECVVTLKAGTSTFKIKSCSAEEFPDLPVEEGLSHRFPVHTFSAGIRGSILACSKDESKHILQGVNLKISADGLEFAATDGHRLGIVELVTPDCIEQPNTDDETEVEVKAGIKELTIPSTALQCVQAMLGTEEMVEMLYSSDQVTFKSGNWVLTSRTLEGKYPNYRSLIAKTFDRVVMLDRKKMIESLERVSVFTDSNNLVKLAINGETSSLDLSAENQIGSNGQESLTVEIKGKDLNFAFNIRYLTEGLKSLVTDTILMELNGAKNPVIFTPIGGNSRGLHLLMPVDFRA